MEQDDVAATLVRAYETRGLPDRVPSKGRQIKARRKSGSAAASQEPSLEDLLSMTPEDEGVWFGKHVWKLRWVADPCD